MEMLLEYFALVHKYTNQAWNALGLTFFWNQKQFDDYRISGKFRGDLIFAIFAIFFKSQNIEYVEIISCIIFYIK